MVNLKAQDFAWLNEKKTRHIKIETIVFNSISSTFIGPTYIVKTGARIVINRRHQYQLYIIIIGTGRYFMEQIIIWSVGQVNPLSP